jgi:hypothetical protein
VVTTEREPPPAALPPDPELYDSPRARIARAKGLEAPYIAGGYDPDPEKGLAEERKYGKWLLWMVAGLMFGGFVIGIAIALAFGTVP